MADKTPPERTLAALPVVAEAEFVTADADHPAETFKEHLSTLMSTAAIVLITVGVTWGAWPYWGPWALCVGGVGLAAMVSIADASRKPPRVPPRPAVDPVLRRHSPPGPTDPGNLHTRGPGAKP